MDSPPSQVLRALNYWRAQYLPTYAGLRLLAQGIAPSHQTALVENLLRQSREFRYAKYKKYISFKGYSEQREPLFRECLASSPQLAVLEAQVLEDLSRCSAFEPIGNVYSYRWPSERSARSYRYFVDDYDRRNSDIRTQVESSGRSAIVVIADVKSFYPSIDQTRLRKKLDAALPTLGEAQERARSVVEGLLGQTDEGVPIGPAISHALANLYLADFDLALRERFGARYFRYVDDIAVVCDHDEGAEVERVIRAAVEAEALELNAEKVDRVDGSVWVSDAPRLRTYDDAATLDGLGDMIRALLARTPEAYDCLERTLRSEGLPIQLERYRSEVQNAKWRNVVADRLRRRDRRLGFLSRWLESSRPPDIYEVVGAARELRLGLLGKLDRLAASQPRTGNTSHRWFLHNLRKTVAGLLFLLPRDELTLLRDRLPDVQELIPVLRVIEALQTESLSPVLGLPGGPVNSLAMLWRRHQLPRAPAEVDLSTFRAYESTLVLALGGALSLSRAQRESARQGHARVLLDAVCGVPVRQRALNDHSYADEMQTLGLGVRPEALASLIGSGLPDEDPLTELDVFARMSG